MVDNPDNNAPPPSEEQPIIPHGPLDIMFPVDPVVWRETRKLIIDKTMRVESVSTCASQDPVIVIELLKISNAMFFAGGRSAITSVRTSIVRLGSDTVVEALENIKDRPQYDDPKVAEWFEFFRSKCRRTSIVSRILSEAVARQLQDDCAAAGLLIAVGEMLAVAHLRDRYVQLADEHSRSGVNYRLAQQYNFNTDQMGIEYLKKVGIPEILIFAIDREARPRSPDRAIMRPICLAAAELVDAFDNNRWEKLAPGASLPPKSNVRMLQMADNSYLRVYERTAEYLFSARLTEEKRKQAREELPEDPFTEETSDFSGEELATDIENLIKGTAEEIYEPEEVKPAEPKRGKIIPRKDPTAIVEEEAWDNTIEEFSLHGPLEERKPRTELPSEIIAPPELRTSKGNAIVSSISLMFDQADNSEDLLKELLAMLVDDQGPFEKSALIVVSRNRNHAIVVAARGPNIGNGQRLSLDDPLSPLAQCFSKVQSFGNRESKNSPFGSKAFALAPIDVNHDTPVALYADCGNNGSLTFESRRVFRTVVDILNQKLPGIPGGLPVELEE